MKLSFEMNEDKLLVRLYGELDHHSARGIGEKIDLEIRLQHPKRVCIDFGDLGFMDSSGLAVIMGRRRLCAALGVPFSIANLKGSIRKVLMMSGIHKYVKIEENNYEIH